MKIVTLNLRYPAPGDGKNYFFNRLPLIVERIRQEAPDVLCFQEAMPESLQALRRELPAYAFFGVGREADYGGEACPIACRRETIALHAMDQFWLSDTPRVPGSRYREQSICPRICTWVKLYQPADGKKCYIVNTHLDHEFEAARTQGLTQILGLIKALEQQEPLPLFLTGDFNLEPQDAPYALIRDSGLTDVTRDIPPTFHDFGRGPAMKIDYILTNRPSECCDVTAWHEERDGVFLSDHDAVALRWQ